MPFETAAFVKPRRKQVDGVDRETAQLDSLQAVKARRRVSACRSLKTTRVVAAFGCVKVPIFTLCLVKLKYYDYYSTILYLKNTNIRVAFCPRQHFVCSCLLS